MLDELLFQRGCIIARIGDETDDYDSIVPDHYFKNVLGLSGEVLDSNGSEYTLVSIDKDDKFVIFFNVYENQFRTDGGEVYEFEELVVQCTGAVVQEDDYDVLRLDTFDVQRVK